MITELQLLASQKFEVSLETVFMIWVMAARLNDRHADKLFIEFPSTRGSAHRIGMSKKV